MYIDNELIIDKWVDQPASTYSVTQTLSAGLHEIKIEYYENGGGAVAKFNMEEEISASPGQGFQAMYFNTKDLSEPVALTRTDDEIDFEWGGQSPAAQVNSDSFSARWLKEVALEEGTYTFSITGDDGYRLYIDDELLINKWHDQARTFSSTTKYLSNGSHLIRIEYYENSGEVRLPKRLE